MYKMYAYTLSVALCYVFAQFLASLLTNTYFSYLQCFVVIGTRIFIVHTGVAVVNFWGYLSCKTLCMICGFPILYVLTCT